MRCHIELWFMPVALTATVPTKHTDLYANERVARRGRMPFDVMRMTCWSISDNCFFFFLTLTTMGGKKRPIELRI